MGSKLLKSAEEVVRKKGGHKISLYVDAKRKNVMEFYTKRGYFTDNMFLYSYKKEF